ncbi:MAG TPA: hypothetical protein VFI30_03060 [Nocardioidaceae bacterium]|nr:hypothetical protein [Nocardioidaceae bacterium]
MSTGFTSLHPRRAAGAAVVATGVLALVAACGGNSGATSPASSMGTTAAGHGSAAATVDMRSGPLGRYLTDASGRSVYLFTADQPNKSNCSTSCLAIWQPFLTTGVPKAGSGVKASMLGTTKATDGKLMVTYKGQPLYFYSSDSAPGQTAGQGKTTFGGHWYLIAPSGSAITGGASSGHGSPSTGSSSTSNPGSSNSWA